MNWPLFENSFLVAAGATVLALAVGGLAALCLAGLEPRMRRGVMVLAVIALAMPPFVVTNCWLELLGATGPLRRWLPMNIYSLGGAVGILALLVWPIALFAVFGAWQRLEPSHLESEPALRGLALLHRLVWPMTRTAAGLALALIFVLALGNFAVPAILQVKVLPAEMWVSFNTSLKWSEALRLGAPLVAGPLLLVLLLGRAREPAWSRLEGGVGPGLFRRQLGLGWWWAAGSVTTLAVLFSVVGPLAQLALGRRTWLELGPALCAGWPAVWNSTCNGVIAATATIGVGWSLARFGQQGRGRVPFGGAFLWLPLFLPGIFIGLALVAVLNRPGLDWFYRSVGVVWLALCLRYLGLAWFGARLARQSLDRDLTDAARLEGAGGWRLFSQIQWPQIGRQLVAIWYVVYLLTLWDVETLVLIVPPGGETLALRIFNLLHYGHSGQVNALCVGLLGVALAPLVAWQAMQWIANWVSRLPTGSRRVPVLGGGVALFLLAGCGGGPPADKALAESRLFHRVEIIGRPGTGAGEFSKPRSLIVDRQDHLYVADMTGRIQKFSPEGRFLLSWQMPETDLGKPKGMACDAEGNIVVIEPHYQRVNHFSPDGRLVARWGGHCTNGGHFSLPRAVAVNGRGEVLVSEYTLHERVQVFAAFGKTLRFSFGRAGLGPGEFNRPEGLGVDAAGRIYVADSCNHRVQVFTPDGRFLRAYGRAGSAPGEFSYPYDVQVDAQGRQFVCEFGNSRIQVFDTDDRLLEVLGGPGAAPGRFSNPWALALDSHGNLYVADAGNHRVQRFVPRQRLARGRRGAAPGRVPDPDHAAANHIDPETTEATGRGLLRVP